MDYGSLYYELSLCVVCVVQQEGVWGRRGRLSLIFLLAVSRYLPALLLVWGMLQPGTAWQG